MSAPKAGRRVFATRSIPMQPYDLDGPVQADITYAPLL